MILVGPRRCGQTTLAHLTNVTPTSIFGLTSFTATLGSNGCPGIAQVQVSRNGSTYYYWTGAAWAASDGTYAQSSTAAATSSNANTFPSGGGGSLYWKALLKSNGLQPCEIDDLSFGATR